MRKCIILVKEDFSFCNSGLISQIFSYGAVQEVMHSILFHLLFNPLGRILLEFQKQDIFSRYNCSQNRLIFFLWTVQTLDSKSFPWFKLYSEDTTMSQKIKLNFTDIIDVEGNISYILKLSRPFYWETSQIYIS